MPVINFKLSDREKHDALWALLNAEFNEESNWTVTYGISAVYEDYALVYNYETGEYGRAYYTKNDDNDMVEIKEIVKCYILDVTENEKATLDTLRALNGGNYELVNEVLVNAQENMDKNSEFSAKIDELNETIATLNTEHDELSANYEKAQNDLNTLKEENEALNTYKLGIETQQKNAVINEYSELLDEEILNAYREKIADYSCDELDMHLAYELKKNHSSIFTKDESEGFVPKDVPLEGISAILSKYKK